MPKSDVFLTSVLTVLGYHSGTQNPLKYHKNRFPEASLSDPVSGPFWDPFGLPFLKQYNMKIVKINWELLFQIENDLLGVHLEN